MSDDWIKSRTAKAKAEFSSVALAVVEEIENLLKGPLSECDLSKGELTKIAKRLVAIIGPVQQEGKPQP